MAAKDSDHFKTKDLDNFKETLLKKKSELIQLLHKNQSYGREIDSEGEAMDIVDGRIRLVGNINNPKTLFAQGPEEVRQEVYRCMDAGVDMIAPECAVPLATRLENILEIRSAVRDWCDEHY